MTVTTTSNTKDALRDAARILIAKNGYAAVSMREIADVVGVRPAAIYNHFESKQALLRDLMVGHMTTLLAELKRAMADVPKGGRFPAFCRFHVGYHIDFPTDVFLAYMELRSLEPTALQEVLSLRDAYESYLRDILKGLGNETPELTGRIVLAMLTGITNWYRPDGPLDKHTLIDVHVSSACKAVGCAT